MITYRLADSLPKEVLAWIDAEIKVGMGLGVPGNHGGETAELGLGVPRRQRSELGLGVPRGDR